MFLSKSSNKIPSSEEPPMSLEGGQPQFDLLSGSAPSFSRRRSKMGFERRDSKVTKREKTEKVAMDWPLIEKAIKTHDIRKITSLVREHGITKLLEIKNENGMNILHLACKESNVSIVHFLLKKGVDTSPRTDSGEGGFSLLIKNFQFPKDTSVTHTYLSSILSRFLPTISEKEINLEDKNGNTALHFLVMVGAYQPVVDFIEKGANPNKEDKNGKIALDFLFSYYRDAPHNAGVVARSRNSINIASCLLPRLKEVKKWREWLQECVQVSARSLHTFLIEWIQHQKEEFEGDFPQFTTRPSFQREPLTIFMSEGYTRTHTQTHTSSYNGTNNSMVHQQQNQQSLITSVKYTDELIDSYYSFRESLTKIQKYIMVDEEGGLPSGSSVKFTILKILNNVDFGDAMPLAAKKLIRNFILSVNISDTLLPPPGSSDQQQQPQRTIGFQKKIKDKDLSGSFSPPPPSSSSPAPSPLSSSPSSATPIVSMIRSPPPSSSPGSPTRSSSNTSSPSLKKKKNKDHQSPLSSSSSFSSSSSPNPFPHPPTSTSFSSFSPSSPSSSLSFSVDGGGVEGRERLGSLGGMGSMILEEYALADKKKKKKDRKVFHKFLRGKTLEEFEKWDYLEKLVMTNDINAINSLIKENGIARLLEVKGQKDKSLLHFCCEMHSLQILHSLLKNGADPSITTKSGLSPLQILLSDYEFPLTNLRPTLTFLPFILIRFLQGDQERKKKQEEGEEGEEGGRKRMTEEYLGGVEEGEVERDKHGNSVLHLLVRMGAFTEVIQALEMGAQVDCKNNKKEYPLDFIFLFCQEGKTFVKKGEEEDTEERALMIVSSLLPLMNGKKKWKNWLQLSKESGFMSLFLFFREWLVQESNLKKKEEEEKETEKDSGDSETGSEKDTNSSSSEKELSEKEGKDKEKAKRKSEREAEKEVKGEGDRGEKKRKSVRKQKVDEEKQYLIQQLSQLQQLYLKQQEQLQQLKQQNKQQTKKIQQQEQQQQQQQQEKQQQQKQEKQEQQHPLAMHTQSAPTPLSSTTPPPTTHNVNFTHAKITRKLAPTGGSGASIYSCDVDGVSCVMKEYVVEGRGSHLKVAMAKFSKEIELIENLTHPNIVRYLCHIERRGTLRLFITRYETSLRKEIANRALDVKEGLDDPYSLSVIVSLFGDLVSGLHYLHSHNIMHRDLKSDNIFLNFGRSGGHYTAVIGDFDTAKWVDSGVGQTRTIVGTTNYLAPEIVQLMLNPRNAPSYTFKADIWSLAMVLYEVMCLQLPYGDLHMSEAMSLIQKGVRPPIPPNTDNNNLDLDIETLDLYQPAIEIYKKCSVLDPSRRPDTEGLKAMVINIPR